jgi:nitrogen fixation protein NifQ
MRTSTRSTSRHPAGRGAMLAAGLVQPGYTDLIAATDDRDDPVTLAFAGVIALAPKRPSPYDVPIAGLSPRALRSLLERRFPYLPRGVSLADGIAAAFDSRHDEFTDLVELLCAHRTVADPTTTWLAYAVATACMAGNHLWQDMGLPDRGVLSSLLDANFTTLARRNDADMKWKKFFYRELCSRAQVSCKSPSCGGCCDYALCFGPEA